MNFNQQRRLLLEQQRREQQWSARQAQRQMRFQAQQSATAHQREVQDLIAAGLNPVLSAQGNGASTGSGAMAEQTSILPELAELLKASHSGGSGTKVIINNEESSAESLTPRQMVQGEHAGQGVHHDSIGSARREEAVKKQLDNAHEALWDSIKDVNFSVRNSKRFGTMPSANGKGSDIHAIYNAAKQYNKAVKTAAAAGLHNHVASTQYDRELRSWFKSLKKRIDPEQMKKVQDLMYN